MPRRFCFLVLLLCYSALNFADTPARVLNIGYYEFHPYSYTNADGQARGSGLDLIRRLAKQAGYKTHFRAYPGPRLYSGLIDGSIDVWFGASGKPELAQHTIESRHHFGFVHLNLYYRRGQPAPKLPHDLKNARMIVISGYSYWNEVNDWLDDPVLAITRHRTSSHTSALAMLQRGRGDFLLNYERPVQHAQVEMHTGELPHLTLQRLALRLIISRNAANAEGLRDSLDLAFEQMPASAF